MKITKRLLLHIFFLTGLVFGSTQTFAEEDLIVFSASSLAPAIEDIAKKFEMKVSFKVRVVPASSSTLARQIENGAPAHIFISANKLWYNYLLDKNLLQGTPLIMAKNSLVLASLGDFDRQNKTGLIEFLSPPFKDRLIVGETTSVPLGIYTKEALLNLGLWDKISLKLAPTRNARSALKFLENKAANLAILYKSDALSSDTVKILASFPEGSHSPVEYGATLTQKSHAQADIFLNFLTSIQARDILIKHGFTVRS